MTIDGLGTDSESNFWEVNPQLMKAGVFKKLFNKDRTKGKDHSSRLMWSIAFIWDRKSKYYNLPEDDKIELVFEDIYGDKNYYEKNTNEVEELRAFMVKLSETSAQRSLREVEAKLDERASFLRNTKYDLGIETEKGYICGTVDILEKMSANTKKIYDNYEDCLKSVNQEMDAASMKGGASGSLSDTGEI